MFLQDIWQESSEEYQKLHEVKSLNVISSAAKQDQIEFNTTYNWTFFLLEKKGFSKKEKKWQKRQF